MSTQELWRDIEGFDNYEVSTLGNVRNKQTGRILTADITQKGYLRIRLGGCKKAWRVHRLVADAFIDKPDGKDIVDHINCVRDDNRVENLRWVTISENAINENRQVKLITDEGHRYRAYFRYQGKRCTKQWLKTRFTYQQAKDAASIWRLEKINQVRLNESQASFSSAIAA